MSSEILAFSGWRIFCPIIWLQHSNHFLKKPLAIFSSTKEGNHFFYYEQYQLTKAYISSAFDSVCLCMPSKPFTPLISFHYLLLLLYIFYVIPYFFLSFSFLFFLSLIVFLFPSLLHTHTHFVSLSIYLCLPFPIPLSLTLQPRMYEKGSSFLHLLKSGPTWTLRSSWRLSRAKNLLSSKLRPS